VSNSVLILRRAQNELASLPTEAYEKIKVALATLSENARPRGCRKLTGRKGWRIRSGNYRVINEIDDQAHTVTVLHIGHRRDIYRYRSRSDLRSSRFPESTYRRAPGENLRGTSAESYDFGISRVRTSAPRRPRASCTLTSVPTATWSAALTTFPSASVQIA
jgi:mRNA interferase RelE/StbE